MRLNETNFERKPALRPEDFGDANAAVLTMASVIVGTITEDGGKRQVVRVVTEEFPDKYFYMNPAGITACIEEYGRETENWRGHDLPVIVTRTYNPVRGAYQDALHVAPRVDWSGLISGTGEIEVEVEEAEGASAERAPKELRTRATKRVAKKSATKKAARRKP